jgi:hypothetical protein
MDSAKGQSNREAAKLAQREAKRRQQERHSPYRDVPKEQRPSKSDLMKAANRPENPNVRYNPDNLRRAGRDYQKHSAKSRGDAAYPDMKDNPRLMNRAGRQHVDRLTSNPARVQERNHPKHGHVIDYRDSAGRGARFSRDGSRLIGFL